MKALQIIESAYRGTIDEQDDTIIWLAHAMQGVAGADLSVVLRGNAVNYAVKGQAATGLAFGEWRQTHAPDIEGDLRTLCGKGVPVYVMLPDLARRGIAPKGLIGGIQPLSLSGLAALCTEADRIWHW